MRLFPKVDGVIDRFDRGGLLSPPFDSDAISVPRFRLYEQAADRIIATAIDAARILSLAGRLAAGLWTLGLSYIDRYANESDRAEIDVEIDVLGNVAIGLAAPSNVQASPAAAGLVDLSWQSIVKRQQIQPFEYQIADTSDLSMILDTIPSTGAAAYTTQLGPPSNGETRRLAVRGRDATGRVTAWALAAAVVTDNQGPAPLTILEL